MAGVIDGETLDLADGSRVRLIGAQPPRTPLGWQGKPWPAEVTAKEALTELTRGATVELRYGGRRTDRYGHLLAQVFVVRDGSRTWVQGEMVGRGLARVYSHPDNTACVAALLGAKAGARDARRGLWRGDVFGIRDAADADALGRLRFSFQLVEGVVRDVGESRRRVYLNFSQDWRRDFTVSVAPRDRRRFERAGLDLKRLAGKRIRVRGWLDYRNGPAIEATHPEQIEVLGAAGVAEPSPESKSPARAAPGSVDL